MTSVASPAVGPITDAALIHRSRQDPELFGGLFDRHATEIHRYLARRIGSRCADDLTSETFLVSFRLRGRYDLTRDDARPWLYGIASNLLRRHHRAERAHYRALARTGVDPLAEPDHADDVVDRVSATTLARQVATALGCLTAKERDALLLFAWTGLSYQDIADALGIPVHTVRSRLNRARTRLREALDHPTTTKDRS